MSVRQASGVYRQSLATPRRHFSLLLRLSTYLRNVTVQPRRRKVCACVTFPCADSVKSRVEMVRVKETEL